MLEHVKGAYDFCGLAVEQLIAQGRDYEAEMRAFREEHPNVSNAPTDALVSQRKLAQKYQEIGGILEQKIVNLEVALVEYLVLSHTPDEGRDALAQWTTSAVAQGCFDNDNDTRTGFVDALIQVHLEAYPAPPPLPTPPPQQQQHQQPRQPSLQRTLSTACGGGLPLDPGRCDECAAAPAELSIHPAASVGDMSTCRAGAPNLCKCPPEVMYLSCSPCWRDYARRSLRDNVRLTLVGSAPSPICAVKCLVCEEVVCAFRLAKTADLSMVTNEQITQGVASLSVVSVDAAQQLAQAPALAAPVPVVPVQVRTAPAVPPPPPQAAPAPAAALTSPTRTMSPGRQPPEPPQEIGSEEMWHSVIEDPLHDAIDLQAIGDGMLPLVGGADLLAGTMEPPPPAQLVHGAQATPCAPSGSVGVTYSGAVRPPPTGSSHETAPGPIAVALSGGVPPPTPALAAASALAEVPTLSTAPTPVQASAAVLSTSLSTPLAPAYNPGMQTSMFPALEAFSEIVELVIERRKQSGRSIDAFLQKIRAEVDFANRIGARTTNSASRARSRSSSRSSSSSSSTGVQKRQTAVAAVTTTLPIDRPPPVVPPLGRRRPRGERRRTRGERRCSGCKAQGHYVNNCPVIQEEELRREQTEGFTRYHAAPPQLPQLPLPAPAQAQAHGSQPRCTGCNALGHYVNSCPTIYHNAMYTQTPTHP